MTQLAMIEKLKRELGEPLTTERQAVYILVEIRKLIEITGQSDKYYALDFYCSWVLHTSMNRAGAVRILERFDRAHPLLSKEQKLRREDNNELNRTMGMERFREQLGDFMHQYGLDPRLARGDWTSFLRLYAAVIDDCPLMVNADNVNLKNISRVKVNLEEAQEQLEGAAGEKVLLYRIRWTCYGKDGQRGSTCTYFTVP